MIAEPRSTARAPYAELAFVGAAFLLLCAAVAAERAVDVTAALLVVTAVLAVGHRVATRWDVLIALLVVIVLAIPIKRYEFAVELPFDLEPYRIVIALLVGLWVAALLVDPRVEPRGTFLDRPLLLIALGVVVSIALNPDTITRYNVLRSMVGAELPAPVRNAERLPFVDVSTDVTKALLFFVSFLLVYYLIVSVVRTRRAIDLIVRTLVAGGAVIAVLAIVERRTGFNAFDSLGSVLPLIQFEGSLEAVGRGGGRLRVYGPAQHPIALAALLVMLLPLSVYLAYVARRWYWFLTTAAIGLGTMATVSRTGVTMLIAAAVVLGVLRPPALTKLWLLALPAAIAIHLAVPGAIGGLRQAFFPEQGIIADQTEYGGRISSRRLGPQFAIIREQPAFGQGYGTRVTAGRTRNARILDNQWLATAVETGLVGVAAWAWLFVRFVRRVGGAAKRDPGPRGWLLAALASSVTAFAVGMFTYDAFSFIQATVILFVLLALGAATLASQADRWPGEPRAEPPPSRPARFRATQRLADTSR